MLNKLSVQASFTASLPLRVLLLAGLAVAACVNIDRSPAGFERIDEVRLPLAADAAAPAVAREGSHR